MTEEPQPEEDTADDLDWLKDVVDEDEDAPDDEIAAEPADDATLTGDEIPEWLKTVEPGDADPDATISTKPVSVEDDTLITSPPVEAAAEPVDEADTTQDAGDMPDWLQSLDSAEEAPDEITAPVEPVVAEEKPPETIETSPDAEPGREDSADIPDWLDDLAESSLADDGEVEPQLQAVDTPDWLAEISEEELETQVNEITTEVEAVGEDVDKTTPEYMRTAAAEALEKEDQEERTLPGFDDLETAEEPEQDFPEWLSTPGESGQDVNVPIPTDEPAADDSAFPEWLATPTDEKPAATEGEPAAEFEDADSAMAWLDDLVEQPDILDDELQSQPAETPVEDETLAAPKDDALDWLKDLDAEEAIPDEQPPKEEPVQATAEATEAAETPDFEDPDAAMAWLEGLAAKQGVSEEELISSPGERPEEPPEWAQDSAAQDTETEEPVSPELPDEGQPEDTEPEPVSGEVTPEDIPEWLQDSAFAPAIEDQQSEPIDEAVPTAQVADDQAKQDGDELLQADTVADTSPQESVDEEAPGDPDDTPDWLKDALSDAPAVIAAEQGSEEIAETTSEEPAKEGEDLPDWLKDVEPSAEPVEDATWIREFGKEVPSFEQPDTQADTDEIQDDDDVKPEFDSFEDAEPTIEIESDEAVADEEPLHDWLQELDDEQSQPEPVVVDDQPAEEEYAWRRSDPEQPAEAKTSQVEPAEEVSQKILDINQASLIELERLPGMGFRKAQTIFSYREEHGAFDKLDDLLLLGIEAETIAGIKDLVEVKPVPKAADPVVSATTVAEAPTEPETETKLTPVSIVPEAPEDAVDEHHATQIGAQERLSKGDISAAMDKYDKLIKKGKRINEIITDLETADQAEPNNPEILQVLGDAYMRADRLQEALDTYSKVEQLLQ